MSGIDYEASSDLSSQGKSRAFINNQLAHLDMPARADELVRMRSETPVG